MKKRDARHVSFFGPRGCSAGCQSCDMRSIEQLFATGFERSLLLLPPPPFFSRILFLTFPLSTIFPGNENST